MEPLAIQLGLEDGDIEEIKINKQSDIFSQVMAVFKCWKDSETGPYTWQFLIKALESKSVNKKTLAEELRLRYL